MVLAYRKHQEVAGKDGCAEKAASQAGKAVRRPPVERARVGERRGQTSRRQVRGSGKGAVAAGFGRTGECRPLGSGKRAGVGRPYLGGPLGRLLPQRLPSARVHGGVHGRGPGAP